MQSQNLGGVVDGSQKSRFQVIFASQSPMFLANAGSQSLIFVVFSFRLVSRCEFSEFMSTAFQTEVVL